MARYIVYPRYKVPRNTIVDYADKESPFMFHEDGTPELVEDEALLAMWETEEQKAQRRREEQKIICAFHDAETKKFCYEREFASIDEMKKWMAESDASSFSELKQRHVSHSWTDADDALLNQQGGWVEGEPAQTASHDDFEWIAREDGTAVRRYKEKK